MAELLVTLVQAKQGERCELKIHREKPRTTFRLFLDAQNGTQTIQILVLESVAVEKRSDYSLCSPCVLRLIVVGVKGL